MTEKVRRQRNVINSGGGKWKAWEIDILDRSFYVQETDSNPHVLERTQDRMGYTIVPSEEASEVVFILAALDKTAHRVFKGVQ